MPSHTLREAGAAVRRAPLLTGLSAAMVALALFVVGLFGVAAHNLRLALQSAEDRVAVVAYLDDDAVMAEVDAAARALAEHGAVRGVRYVSKAEAMEIATTELPEIGELGQGLEVNPFPASLEIELEEGSTSPEIVAQVATLAEAYTFVEETQFGQEWVDRLYTLRRIGGISTIVIGSAFAVVGALIIGTAIRIAIFARKDEIYVMRLVGAKDSFVRRPFLLEGSVTGIVGGLLAAALTWITFRAVYSFLFTLSWIPIDWVLLGIMGGGLFGMVASWIAVRRHLREV